LFTPFNRVRQAGFGTFDELRDMLHERPFFIRLRKQGRDQDPDAACPTTAGFGPTFASEPWE
jgi:hypothetical protein